METNNQSDAPLKQRSNEKELMDLGEEHYSPEEYQHCLLTLFRINVLFGFFSSTVKVLKKIPHLSTVKDIGCGSGLFLIHLSRYFPHAKFIGMDISSSAIELAKQQALLHSTEQVSFELQTIPSFTLPENNVDVILTTLVCHHLSDEELVVFLRTLFFSASKAVIINDLHRHWLPHFLYKLISPLFRNRLISHDGLISIRRGFTRSDWQTLLRKTNITHYQITWCFPFRWRVLLWKT